MPEMNTSSLMINSSNVTWNTMTMSSSSTMSIWIHIVTLTCMILIDISAFLGNLLVICAFLRTRRLQTVTNYFIASLAFADALVAIFVLPLSIYYYQRNRSWKLGLILCDLWVSSDVLLCTSSILNLTCISVDRYMAITKPLTYTAYRSKFLARMMILLVWVVSAAITCPPIFGWRDKNRRQTVEEKFQCDLNTARGYVLYSALGSFYIPAVVMIFVYIRIFMVVYDRENLIKKFHNDHSSTLSLKSNANSLINPEEISKKQTPCARFSSCCCRFFRKTSSSLPQYSYNHCPAVEQKQNGYLVYRFTNNNTNNSNNNYVSNPNSPMDTPPSNAKTSLFCQSCTNSKKKLSHLSEEIYQYRRNYLAHIAAEYQFRTEESPCYELKTFENSLSPLMKCRSRSFDHPTSKIRDLNTELSHSRQLKAAAVAAAAAAGSTSGREAFKQHNELDKSVHLHRETKANELFPSIDESSKNASQSFDELTQISISQTTRRYKKNNQTKQSNLSPMRQRSTTNPNNMLPSCSHSPSHSHTGRQKQSVPEPTRINRRMKSSRVIQNSPSALLIENFKQSHRITRNSSIRSTQSSKSLSSMRLFANGTESNFNENNLNRNSSMWRCCCCCYSPTMNHIVSNRMKSNFNYTPNQSLTNDEDDDDKMSSTEISNRTPVHSSSLPRASGSSNGTPGDVHRRERIRFMKEQKTAKTLAVVVGGFILFWLPFFIMYIIPPEKHHFNDYTATLITWLGYFNSVINPFIYAYCSKQFRMAFWNITFGICMKKSAVLLPIASKNKQLHQRRINS